MPKVNPIYANPKVLGSPVKILEIRTDKDNPLGYFWVLYSDNTYGPVRIPKDYYLEDESDELRDEAATQQAIIDNIYKGMSDKLIALSLSNAEQALHDYRLTHTDEETEQYRQDLERQAVYDILHPTNPGELLAEGLGTVLSLGIKDVERSAAEKFQNAKSFKDYTEAGLEALSPFLFNNAYLGNGLRLLYGGYHLADENGVRKTWNEIKQGNWGNAALSATGDLLNAGLAVAGGSGMYDMALDTAAKFGNANAKAMRFARALNRDIASTSRKDLIEGLARDGSFNTRSLVTSHEAPIVVSQPYIRWSPRGYLNEAVDVYPLNKHNLFFQIVSDVDNPVQGVFNPNGNGQFSIHFKTTRGGITPTEKLSMFLTVADVIPEGGILSTWGDVTKGGFHGLRRFGNDFNWTLIGVRQNGNYLAKDDLGLLWLSAKNEGIPVYHKPTTTRPFMYDPLGNFVGNPNNYYRFGWGIIDDALDSGVIRVPEGDYKPAVFEKYPFLYDRASYSTQKMSHKFPYFLKGGPEGYSNRSVSTKQYKYGENLPPEPEDLIVIPEEGVEWSGAGKFSDLHSELTPAETGGRGTPLVEGQTNRFPTSRAQLFKFNTETLLYEPITVNGTRILTPLGITGRTLDDYISLTKVYAPELEGTGQRRSSYTTNRFIAGNLFSTSLPDEASEYIGHGMTKQGTLQESLANLRYMLDNGIHTLHSGPLKMSSTGAGSGIGTGGGTPYFDGFFLITGKRGKYIDSVSDIDTIYINDGIEEIENRAALKIKQYLQQTYPNILFRLYSEGFSQADSKIGLSKLFGTPQPRIHPSLLSETNPLQVRLARLRSKPTEVYNPATQAILTKPIIRGDDIRKTLKALAPDLTEEQLDEGVLIAFANRRGVHLPIGNDAGETISGVSIVDIQDAINFLRESGIKSPTATDIGIIAGHEAGHGVRVSLQAYNLIKDYHAPDEFFTQVGQVFDKFGLADTKTNPIQFDELIDMLDLYLREGYLDNGISKLKSFLERNFTTELNKRKIMSAINQFSVRAVPIGFITTLAKQFNNGETL